MLIVLTKIRDFVRMLTRAVDKFLLERLIFYTVPNTVSQQIAIGLSRLGPFKLQDIGASAQDSEKIICVEFESFMKIRHFVASNRRFLLYVDLWSVWYTARGPNVYRYRTVPVSFSRQCRYLHRISRIRLQAGDVHF